MILYFHVKLLEYCSSPPQTINWMRTRILSLFSLSFYSQSPVQCWPQKSFQNIIYFFIQQTFIEQYNLIYHNKMIECTSGKQTKYWLDLLFHKATIILDVYLLSYLILSQVGKRFFNILIEKSFSKSSWMMPSSFKH